MRRVGLSALWVVAGCAAGGPTRADSPGILAPQALQPILEPVVAAWETAHGSTVRLGFDAPERLMRQANGGTHADIFVSADARWMDALVSDGHVEEQSRRPIAYDPLVFVAPAGQRPVRDPRDLVVRLNGPLGIGTPDGPPGELARRALEETKVWEAVEPRMVAFRDLGNLRASLEDGTVEAAVTMQSATLLARDTLATHPFSPDLAFGSVVEVAPLRHDSEAPSELVADLLAALADGPDARAGWARAGLDGLRGPGPTNPPPRTTPPGASSPSATSPLGPAPPHPPPRPPSPNPGGPTPPPPVDGGEPNQSPAR